MKKSLSLFLVLTLLFLCAACSKQAGDGAPKDETSEGEKTAEEKKEEEKEGAQTSEDQESKKETEEEAKKEEVKEEKKEEEPRKAEVEETVMYDEGGVKITAKSLSYNDREAVLTLFFENKSDQYVLFSTGDQEFDTNYVNSFAVRDGHFAKGVEAGKSHTGNVNFDSNRLASLGIKEIREIELIFRFYDYDMNLLKTEKRALKTNLYDSKEPGFDDYQALINNPEEMAKLGRSLGYYSSDCLYDVNGIRHLNTAFMTSASGSKTLALEFENKGEQDVNIYYTNLFLDGLRLPKAGSRLELRAGKKRVLYVNLNSAVEGEFWDEVGIKSVANIAFNLAHSPISEETPTEYTNVKVTLPGAKAEMDLSGQELYNQNGIRIVRKPLLQSSNKNSPDYYFHFLVENKTAERMLIDLDPNSFKVNSVPDSHHYDGMTLAPGETTILYLSVPEWVFSEMNIKSLSDIKEVEFTLLLLFESMEDVVVPIKLTF